MFDHIFYNDNKLRVLKLLEIPQEDMLCPAKAGDTSQQDNLISYLPNSVFPSDHLRLEVEFEFKDEGPERKEKEPIVSTGIESLMSQA